MTSCPRPNSRTRRAAFTLVETMLCLLVVAIVGAGAMAAVSEVLGLKARIEFEQRALRDARQLLDTVAAKPVEQLVNTAPSTTPISPISVGVEAKADEVLAAFPTLSALAGFEPAANTTSLAPGMLIVDGTLERATLHPARTSAGPTGTTAQSPWDDLTLASPRAGTHYRVRVVPFDGLNLPTTPIELAPGVAPRVLLVEVAAWQVSPNADPNARRLFTLRTLRTTAWDMALGMRPVRVEASLPPPNR